MKKRMNSINLSKEAKELAQKAKLQKINNGTVTVKCGMIPEVEIVGQNYESVLVRCVCGYISCMELGI